MTIITHLYPNGEFVVANPLDTKGRSIDLTDALNSHKTPRAPRGSGGFTSLGKRSVRNGAYIMQRMFGKQNIAFLTLTIPGGPAETEAIAADWSQVIREFHRWLRYHLKEAGLSQWYVGVTEVQEKRCSRDGGMPLHLHVVFQCRKHRSWKGYPIDIRDIKDEWRRILSRRLERPEELEWGGCADIQPIRHNAEHYLSKYLSKGSKRDEVGDSTDNCKLPSAWWTCHDGLRKYIRRESRSGKATAARILNALAEPGTPLIESYWEVEIEVGDQVLLVARCGRIRGDSHTRTHFGLTNWNGA